MRDKRVMNDAAPQIISPAPTNSYELGGASDYLALLKPRVMSLSIFTALVGMVAAGVASSDPVNLALAAISLLAIAIGAGASGALNMWFDADIDAVMARTSWRPVPRGAVPPAEAAGLGGALSALSVALLALSSNYVAAGLLAFTIFFYVAIYSMWLKRTTPQNIVIGGAAGALPPVVAWAAISGAAPIEAWVLFVIIFLWTPPHFWALALFREGDYARAGVPMMPNVAGEASTRNQIVVYSALLVMAGFAPFAVGMAGLAYLLVSLALGVQFMRLAWRVRVAPMTDKNAPKALFRFSILYLFALFAIILIEDVAQIGMGAFGNG